MEELELLLKKEYKTMREQHPHLAEWLCRGMFENALYSVYRAVQQSDSRTKDEILVGMVGYLNNRNGNGNGNGHKPVVAYKR